MNCSNIIFVGGIHGVGKSTICNRICAELNIEYLSASELIKWRDLNEDVSNKKVSDLSLTQNRLIEELKNRLIKNKTYILDGHYCLLDRNNEVEKISFETFEQIKPKLFVIVVKDVNEIKKQLEERDSKPYDYHLLEKFQDNELSYVKHLANILNTPYYIYNNKNYFSLIRQVETILKIGK